MFPDQRAGSLSVDKCYFFYERFAGKIPRIPQTITIVQFNLNSIARV